ncbi:MAG: CPBP family intramembrane glutamic endopeptidase, partial [Rhodococcus sp. (in: high G+C Gram-positive bacteria)]
SGMAPMNAVHHVDAGLSQSHWRAEVAAARRRPGQRWGIPATAAVLLLNLAGFLTLPFLLNTDVPGFFVFAIMVPSVLALTLSLAFSWYRGNGPVVDFGLPTSVSEFGGQFKTGVAWGSAALGGGFLLALVVLSQTDLSDQAPLGGLPDVPMPWKIVLALWIWLGAPFCEEIMFRGMLWGALERRVAPTAFSWLGNRWVILVITAVLFALWHREGWRFVVLLWGGIAIGMARMRSGSVTASTTAHSVNNTLPALAVLIVA